MWLHFCSGKNEKWWNGSTTSCHRQRHSHHVSCFCWSNSSDGANASHANDFTIGVWNRRESGLVHVEDLVCFVLLSVQHFRIVGEKATNIVRIESRRPCDAGRNRPSQRQIAMTFAERTQPLNASHFIGFSGLWHSNLNRFRVLVGKMASCSQRQAIVHGGASQ